MSRVLETVLEMRSFWGDEWPESAAEFVGRINEAYAAIPDEYKGAARTELDYDSEQATLKMYYHRPETVAEIAAREAERQKHEQEFMRREVAGALQTLQRYGVKVGNAK